LEDFYLDTIRTHAFAAFKTIDAAIKVRTTLDGRIWPEERGRKPLQVNFIPEDKLREFIGQETRAGDGGRATARSRRWEVVYTQDADGKINVSLQEVEIRPASSAPAPAQALSAATVGQGLGLNMKIPTGPRSMVPQRLQPESERKPESSRFLALDTLFKSTTSKPKLYFQPVPEDLAESRLRQLQAGQEVSLVSRGQDEKCRYTWENGQLVNGGPEWGLRRDRGRRAGFRRGGHGTRDQYRPSDNNRLGR